MIPLPLPLKQKAVAKQLLLFILVFIKTETIEKVWHIIALKSISRNKIILKFNAIAER